MSAAHAIPEAWPLFLCVEQLEAYLGMDIRTIRHICPVAPLDFGNSLVRYHRLQIDAWAATLPPRLPKSASNVNTPESGPMPAADQVETPRLSPAEKARRRAQEKQKWPKAS